MQAIRSRDTAPEMAVRRLLHAMGLRYRVHYKPIPTLNRRADIVFTRQRVAVFIDGCFWHGCPEHGAVHFGVHQDYWSEKITRNMARDADTDERLNAQGWSVIRFWQHTPAVRAAETIAVAIGTLRRDAQ
jgi:DNA mismatch endonuclease (patch repair protein)